MIVGGVLGAVAGLVLGLRAHPATAWFAVFELGIPAAIVGTLLGAVAGAVASVLHRLRTRGEPGIRP
jgi:gas vesicle protein